ncbi:ATP-binding cassette domain-containing protein [Terasakiella sp. A23]|uniref:peptidase domain-containing ABC transporter n=1 Tax=Terasakiella sp. FCG-A23 TaxID=3080561 RepID=UPI002953CA2D|nr:ATP-binding cassette domain-containing protein [Terasakiella sp. A23]MDV7340302.1 ATP-binding cassette domain-containing protein [Terasakiella sp. A23]
MFKRDKDKKVDWLARLGKNSKIPFGMFDILLASLFINLLSLAMPLSLLQIYDRILPNSSLNTLAMLIGGIAIALLLEAALRIGRAYLSGWVGARFEHMAGCAAIERVLSTSVNDFEKEGSGVHLERIGSLGTLKEFYAGQAMMTLFDLPFAFIFLMLISYLAGSLVFVPIVLITLFALSAWRVGGSLRSALAERMQADERRFNFIIEVLRGIHTLKSMAMETQMLRRYERLQEACAKTDYDVTRHSSTAMGLGALYSQVTMFAVVGFGSTFVIDGQLTVGGLAACTMLSGRSMQPLQRAVGIWARFQSIQLARDKMREIFELQPETQGNLPAIGAEYEGHIELRNVALQFEEDQPPLFQNVNLTVEPGQIIGISGGNASGKSSLLYLMMGAMRTSQGEVLIGGQEINEIDPSSVRRKIAYLPQHGVLFNGTILDNLTMFKPELEEKALRMARLLGLDDVVARMPLGYDTHVGNGAYDSLPRGIKQRVAIARALMSDPVVLLFDEANAAMDSAGDRVLTEFLEQARGKRTLILVSHRPSLLRMADEVYDLNNGELIKREAEQFTPPPAAPGPQVEGPKGPVAPAPAAPAAPVAPQQPPVQPQAPVQPQQTAQNPVVQHPTEQGQKTAPKTMAEQVLERTKLKNAEKMQATQMGDAMPKRPVLQKAPAKVQDVESVDVPEVEKVKQIKSKIKVIPPTADQASVTEKPKFVLKKRAKQETEKTDG